MLLCMPPCIEVVKQGEVSLVPLSAPVRRLPLVLVVDSMGAAEAQLHVAYFVDVVTAAPTGVDYIELHSL